MELKTKVNDWDLIKLKRFCTAKGNHTQNEKTAYRMGENICQQCDRQGINFQKFPKINKQLIQLNTEKQNKEQLNQNIGRRHK